MSHEIRTPMNAITGFTYLLLQENLSDIQKTQAKQIDLASKQLLNLINDILDLSKVEAKKLTIDNSDFNLFTLLNELQSVMEFAASVKSVPLIFTIPKNTSHHLEGDPHRLKQILTNLLSNAIKFSERGDITLTVSQIINQEMRIANTKFVLSDQGIGMTENELTKLFQSFSQVDSSKTRKYGGTGLGLAISQQLANLMGGEISVTSVYGTGSTFTLELPFNIIDSDIVKSSFATNEKQNVIDKQIAQIKGKEILLVEDNRVNQMVATGILKKYGLNISIADNGKIAVDKVKNNRFELILMDLHMPVMDGHESSKAIREIYSLQELPIIAMTADALIEIEQACLDSGMNDYLTKPININKLESALIKYLL